MTRLRLDISHLNAHSFQIGLHPSPKCLCESPFESSKHFLTECFLCTEERNTLYDQVTQFSPKFRSFAHKRQFEILTQGFEKHNPELLIKNTKILGMTQIFILKTKRFILGKQC